jgi:uncharacterized protein (TIGR02001 family)
LFSTHTFADVSANINVTDDYIYRGISNSDNDPAIQGGIDYFNDAGLYAGIWATSMDFQYPDGEPGYEFDMYGGITGEIANTSWDIGFLRFTYPNGASKYQLDSHEFHLGLSRSFEQFTAATKYHYSPDYSGAGNSHYLEAKIDVALPYDLNFTLHAGHQRFENNTWYGLPDYTDWRVAVGRDIAGFNVELGWTDTNVSDQQACFGGTTWCQSTVNINIRRDFQLF